MLKAEVWQLAWRLPIQLWAVDVRPAGLREPKCSQESALAANAYYRLCSPPPPFSGMRPACFHNPLAAVEVEACSERASSFAFCVHPQTELESELELEWLYLGHLCVH